MRATRGGYTLIELVIAMLLIALAASGLLSVALSGRMSGTRVQRQAAGVGAARKVSEALKAYVTADPSLAVGPGVGADGWSLPGDSSGLRALAPGAHPLDAALWAPELAAAGGSIRYDVTVRQTPSGPQPTVTFQVSWPDP